MCNYSVTWFWRDPGARRVSRQAELDWSFLGVTTVGIVCLPPSCCGNEGERCVAALQRVSCKTAGMVVKIMAVNSSIPLTLNQHLHGAGA